MKRGGEDWLEIREETARQVRRQAGQVIKEKLTGGDREIGRLVGKLGKQEDKAGGSKTNRSK